MTVRTRIVLIVLGIVTVVLGLLGYTTWLREQAAEAERERLRLAATEATFELVTEGVLERAEALLLAHLDTTGVVDAAIQHDLPLVRALTGGLVAELEQPIDLVRLDLYDTSGDLVYSSDEGYFAASLLGEQDPFPLDRREPLRGTRVMNGQLRGISVLPLEGGEERLGTAVLVLDLASSFARLARVLDATILVLDRRGGVVGENAGVDLKIWGDRLDPSRPQRLEGEVEDRVLEVASVLATDAGGGRSATILAVRDLTSAIEQRRLGLIATFIASLVLALLALAMLWLYLQRAFRPLVDAIEALEQLARGRTDHYAELRSGSDEIGRISRAIEVFRQQALQIERNEDLEERRQRRQARFIRRQMATLSETLDEEGQASALEDLRHIEAAGTGAQDQKDVAQFSDQLGLIGVALERMTARVRSQQQALTELVAELREALAIKTRLIGLEQELDIARQMQQNILPRAFPPLPDFEIAARMRPAREVGGDFYDAFAIDARRIGVAVADVSGKGIPAAFFMLIARTLLKAIALEGLGPSATIERLNEFLCRENETTMFVTVFYAELDLVDRTITYTNAGHNQPLRVAPHAPPSRLSSTNGVALAVFDGLKFEQATIRLEPGDVLVLYTDGITEAFDGDGRMFGDDRFASVLEQLGACEADSMVTEILGAVDRFSGEAPQSDDMTVIVLAALSGQTARTRPVEIEHAAAE
jgi:sigma-B regulation protein RsbU (phosphoserine phosphatase)